MQCVAYKTCFTMKTLMLVAALAALAGMAPSACAKDDVPPVSVCTLAAGPSQYHQKLVQLHADVVAEPHGYHLVDRACPNESVGLVVPEHSINDAKFDDMMGKIMAHHARGHVVLTGVFLEERTHHQAGTFTANDVLSVATSDHVFREHGLAVCRYPPCALKEQWGRHS